MEKIKAAVVGAGIYGSHHINAYLNNEKTELVGVCDLDQEKLDNVNGFDNRPLNEKYLMGYYCQMAEYKNMSKKNKEEK